MEAQIRHHSHDNGVVGQCVVVTTINSGQSNQSIAVDYSSIFINCNQAIAVSVKCKTNINRNTSASTADEFTQRLWRCRTARIVDVTAIGCITHGDHIGTESLQHQWCNVTHRPIGRVNHDPQTSK